MRCVGEQLRIGAREHGVEPLEVSRPRDLGDAERCKMIRSPLNIDQSGMIIDQAGGQRDDRCLRSVGAAMKFGFGCEQPTNAEAVQAAHEFSVAPGLDTVGPTKLVETSVGPLDSVVDPAVRSGRFGAPGDDIVECAVDPKLEVPHGSPQRTTDMKVVELEDPAGVRRPPTKYASALKRHRKKR